MVRGYGDSGRRNLDTLELLALTGGLEATDPRDNIYVLASVFPDPGLVKGLLLMYTVPTAETYVDFARYMVNNSPFRHQLNILGCLDYMPEPGNGMSLPPWVPSWDVMLKHPAFRKWLCLVENNQVSAHLGVLYRSRMFDPEQDYHISVHQPLCDREAPITQGFVIDEVLAGSGDGNTPGIESFDAIHNPC
ncbi:hypothetical protein B0T14DRAFT_565269 [Immersiella caudata]|uniref:Uncharacterized protein n=1 Tax=Immersiella caudata TaxID=314043 RepID=A0AA40C406_9PEZI|nr:hypothetical protein B0T14DRAFT_565269 [Immersiella caudata]